VFGGNIAWGKNYEPNVGLFRTGLMVFPIMKETINNFLSRDHMFVISSPRERNIAFNN